MRPGGHKVAYFRRSEWDHYFRCNCGASCDGQRTKQMAEDQWHKHEREIARIETHQKWGSGTMRGDYLHALEMSTAEGVSESDKKLWAQLARDIGRRLGIGVPEEKQEELFTL